jgi:4-carboxymuconolactone decarboxylase
MPETPSFGRYAEIPYDQMTPEQQEAYRFAVETRGPLGGPNKIWVHNPKLAKVAAPFGGHFQPGKYSLSEREREIAVIVINSKWRSAYPTAAHERRGKEVGLPAAKVEAMLSGCRPYSRMSANRLCTKWRSACRMHAGSRRGFTTAPSRRWAMSASPT